MRLINRSTAWLTARNGFRFLEQHIFYGSLRGGRLNLGPFQEKLDALSDKQLEGYVGHVPAEWRNESDFCERIVRENEMERFAEHVAEEIGSHDVAEMVLRDKPKSG